MSTPEPTLADWGERRFLHWLGMQEGTKGDAIGIGIGQDAALIHFGKAREAFVTADALIEGVHFNREWTTPADLGHKSLAVNLSDLAAMGAEPVACFLTLGLPPLTPVREVQEFFGGLLALAIEFECPLAGGDLVRAPQWTISITAIGKPANMRQIPSRRLAIRDQGVYVTGWPGESAAGLEALRRGDNEPELIARHNRPTPRIYESFAACYEHRKQLAMIDVSDGIVNDAGQIMRASDVEITINYDALPVSPALAAYAAKIGRDPREFVLFGGEDYELLFATRTPEVELRRSFGVRSNNAPLTRIGRVNEGEGVVIRDSEGKPMNLTDTTFRHF